MLWTFFLLSFHREHHYDIQSLHFSVKRLDAEVLEAFKLFDKDQDGIITKDEIEGLVKNLGGDTTNPIIKVSHSV